MSVSPSVLSEICRLFDVKHNDLKNLNGYYSHVFEIENRQQVIKVQSKEHTDFDRLNSEILWLNYLRDNNISVAYPVVNQNGTYIDQVDDTYYAIDRFHSSVLPRKDKDQV